MSACCCLDVDAVIRAGQANVTVEHVVTSQSEALALLADLTKRAEKIQSELCKIDSRVEAVSEGFKLTATFNFYCEAESLIFQLGLR